jgi:2-methylcitrate dehydratase PrpD
MPAPPEDPPRSPSVSQSFAGFVAGSSWTDIGDDLRHEAKRSLLNFIGCALGAAESDAVEASLRVLKGLAGPPQATVIGRPERFDILTASYINAVAGNLFDFDDTHLDTVIHPTAPVAPVVLALAERNGASGAEVLHALILGAEVECRIGNGVSPDHYARGWHITATCGVFGAAAAAVKLLGLSSERGAAALGIAASESAGLVENLTTAAKNVGVGNASRNGLFAALMAKAGYEAAPHAIEGPLGWARASGSVPDEAGMLAGLGRHWEFLKNTYKPYPSGIVFHSVIDACLELRAAHRLDPDMIERVTVAGDALLIARGDRPIANERDARVSIHHSAAAALLTGAAGLPEYSSDFVMSPRAIDFRARVRAALDPDLPRGAARVEILLKDGRRFATTVSHARGSIELPLSDDEIASKVLQLARRGKVRDRIETIIDKVWRLEEEPGVGDLMALLTATDDGPR